MSPDGLVGVRETAESIRGYVGLATCASLWVCPVCNAKIMARRALELQCAIALAVDRGWSVGMVTLTMRHHRGQSLAELWDGISKAWDRVRSHRSFKSLRRRGLVGYIRATEVTVGANGWHVHLHVLVFVDSTNPELAVRRIGAAMWQIWSDSLPRLGFGVPLQVAQDWKLLEGPMDEGVSRYLTKAVDDVGAQRIGIEMTSTQTKHARRDFGTRTPWALLTDVLELGDADSARLWWEWERGSHSRRQLTWSRDLRKLLGMTPGQTDEEIVNEQPGTHEDDVVYITPAGWDRMVANPEWIPILLEVPIAELELWLIEHEVEYITP